MRLAKALFFWFVSLSCAIRAIQPLGAIPT
jgi:hypothetical protein